MLQMIQRVSIDSTELPLRIEFNEKIATTKKALQSKDFLFSIELWLSRCLVYLYISIFCSELLSRASFKDFYVSLCFCVQAISLVLWVKKENRVKQTVLCGGWDARGKQHGRKNFNWKFSSISHLLAGNFPSKLFPIMLFSPWCHGKWKRQEKKIKME